LKSRLKGLNTHMKEIWGSGVSSLAEVL